MIRPLDLVLLILVAGMAILSASAAAWPHDIYTDEPKLSPQGGTCCGGDPVGGDCEPLLAEDVALDPSGGMSIVSRRWHAVIRVGPATIQHRALAGSDPRAVGHWCGKTRTDAGWSKDPPEPLMQPDPRFWTFCAWLTPGDV